MASKAKKTPAADPAFAALPGAAEALAAGHKLQLHSDEQSPASFVRSVSRWLPPLAIDVKTGKPIYHIADGKAPGNRENHSRASYRAYADVKYSYLNLGSFPKWVWYAAGAAAAALGLAVALRKR
jgi:hypothetical protein